MPKERPLIVIVDDDQDFLAMVRDVLQAAGYRAACVADPAAAIETMEQEKPRLVVTDLMMTALDSGFSLARKIKEDPRFRDVPIIVVTGVAPKLGFDFTPRRLDDLAAMQADAFLEKPLLPKDLLAKIEELLGRCAQAKNAM
jgi:CheY-like chemotaxis protein